MFQLFIPTFDKEGKKCSQKLIKGLKSVQTFSSTQMGTYTTKNIHTSYAMNYKLNE